MSAFLMGWLEVGQRQYHHNLQHGGRCVVGLLEAHFLLLGKELRNSSVTVKYQ